MTTLTFQNTVMTVINQNNKAFFTATDLGKALEYSDADRSVRRLYTANADEFTPEMTALIEMQTNGGKQQVRIFSLRGAHLIAMFARTKVAKEFRKWVLDILDREVSTGTISPEQQQAIQSAVQQAHHRTGLHWQEIYRQIKAIFHVAKYDQLPADQFGNVMAFITNLQKIEQIAPLAPPPKKYSFDFTEKELNALSWGWFAQYKTNELITYLAEPLQAMGSIFAPRAYSQSREYKYCVEESAKIIYRMTKDFHNSKEHEWKHPLSSIRLFVG